MNKIYRLKKDSLVFKAGTLFELRPGRSANEDVLFKKGTDIALSLDSGDTALQELIAEGSEWFEEVKAGECWTPTDGEGYWHITDIDGAHHAVWIGHEIDEYRLAMGNVFRTEEDAGRAIKWLKARKVLFDDANGFKPDLSDSDSNKQRLWYVGYTSSGDLCADYYYNWITKPGPYFATGEDAKASIEAHEKEWKIYLGVGEC